MTLVPAFLAIVLFGLLPFGQALSSFLAHVSGVPAWACMIAMYLSLIASGVAGLSVLRGSLGTSTGCEFDWLRLGDGRGQRFLRWPTLATLALGVIAAVMSPRDAVSLGCMLGAAFIALVPGWSLRRSTWPLDIASFTPPAFRGEGHAGSSIPAGADDAKSRSYSWMFAKSWSSDTSEHYSLDIVFDWSTINGYAARIHPQPEQHIPRDLMTYLPKYVLDGMTPEVRQCAFSLAQIARQHRFTYLDFADFVLAFVCGAIGRCPDRQVDHQSPWAFPIETLALQKGSDGDLAILAVAIFHALGMDSILIFVRNPCRLAVGVALQTDRPGRWVRYNNHSYHYAEAAGEGGWRLGELPESYDESSDNLTPIPIAARTA